MNEIHDTKQMEINRGNREDGKPTLAIQLRQQDGGWERSMLQRPTRGEKIQSTISDDWQVGAWLNGLETERKSRKKGVAGVGRGGIRLICTLA